MCPKNSVIVRGRDSSGNQAAFGSQPNFESSPRTNSKLNLEMTFSKNDGQGVFATPRQATFYSSVEKHVSNFKSAMFAIKDSIVEIL